MSACTWAGPGNRVGHGGEPESCEYQAGADQEHNRERGLQDDQGIAGAMGLTALAQGPSTGAQSHGNARGGAYFSTGMTPNNRPAPSDRARVDRSTMGSIAINTG